MKANSSLARRASLAWAVRATQFVVLGVFAAGLGMEPVVVIALLVVHQFVAGITRDRLSRGASRQYAVADGVLDAGVLVVVLLLDDGTAFPVLAAAAVLAVVHGSVALAAMPPIVGAAGAAAFVVADVQTSPAVLAWSMVVATLLGVGFQVFRELEREGLENLLAVQRGRSSSLASGAAEAVVLTDTAGVVRSVNGAARDTLALDATAEGPVRCEGLLGMRQGLAALDCSDGCPLLSDGVDDVEVWRELPTGQRQPLLASARLIRDAHGRPSEVLHSLRDITRLKEADEAKSLFLATTSHELKTPLAVITGFANVLLAAEEKGDDTMDRMHPLRAIAARADQMTTMVSRLLLTTKIESGGVRLRHDVVEVGSLVETIAREVDEVAEGHEIRVRGSTDVPAARADREALRVVLDHLLENAVKYQPAGGPIDVDVDADDREVAIRVTDRGIGMTPEATQRCFDKFWQAEGDDSRRFDGTGIGLHVVHTLVEGMAGRIEVASTPGAGSTFTVRLARFDIDEPDEDAATDTGDAASSSGSFIDELARSVGYPGGA